MKKFFLVASLFVAGFAANAQQKAEEVIKVSTEKYDFGKIKQGVPVTTLFTITNTSSKPVAIENARAGCGCTTPEWSKEPFAPGGTSKLKVGYNAAAPGHFEKDVFVKIAGVPEEKVIKITGDVVDAAAFDAAAADKDTKAEAKEVKKEVKAEAKAAKKEAKAAKKDAKVKAAK